MDAPIAILGGTGFVGRHLIERWPVGRRDSLRLLIHRSRPDWVESCGADVRSVDLDQDRSFADALSGCGVMIDLLRPRGDGWLRGIVERLVALAPQISVKRYIRCSSIDVYGRSSSLWISEDTPPEPQNEYEREHIAAEAAAWGAPFDVVILRLGAMFGRGGRNVVAFIDEARRAPAWKLALRRGLYGRRRMHLVSVEKAVDAVMFVAQHDGPLGHQRFLVTDDDAPENNFAYLQDLLMRVYGRAAVARVPELPSTALRLMLGLRGLSNIDPMRRFATDKLRSAGFTTRAEFCTRLERYVETAIHEKEGEAP